MLLIALVLLLCCSLHYTHTEYQNNNEPIQAMSKQNVTSDQKIWKYSIYFSKTLPNAVSRKIDTDLKLKCKASLNFSLADKSNNKDKRVNKSESEILMRISDVPSHILDNIVNKVKIYWLKNNKLLVNNSRLFIEKNTEKGVFISNMTIRKVDLADGGNYTCLVESEIYSVKTHTKVSIRNHGNKEKDGELPSYKPLFPTMTNDKIPFLSNPESTDSMDFKTDSSLYTQFNLKNEGVTRAAPMIPDVICQLYQGQACAKYLMGQYVYIPHTTSQIILEKKLSAAYKVVNFSNDISSNCEGYALPSLCFSTFPICRNPEETNQLFLERVRNGLVSTDVSESKSRDIQFINLPKNGLPSHLDTNLNDEPVRFIRGIEFPSVMQGNGVVVLDQKRLDTGLNSTFLRRVCKRDCQILEDELCQKEYAIAKRHPHIGQQLALEECTDLPDNDPDCLKVGIELMVIASDDNCYWENGVGYLGKVDVTKSGASCMIWSKQMFQTLTNFPELAGHHSYCRNPGGGEPQPWCYVKVDVKPEKQYCDIPKCARKIWIYIISIFVGVSILFIALFICICCKNKNKNSASAIRNINLPNADKNIYGNSRLNSPIEMTDMMTIQSSIPPHHSHNPRTNGILRVPQYTLSQIKFLEELGEGAFGKVYKGALVRGNETIYVAVKALKENASAKTQADFRREIDLISELRHENIVCIVGVALREEPLCMLFEFMARGDLHEFLMGRAPPNGRGLPPLRLLNIAYHIAAGMQYLAAHHYVHRDLAARNCLVADDFVVKISDFGLSRDIYSSDYYRVQSKSLLPVRWMPPESILYGKFTTESDIWSYGVVLWEIYSYGLQPYYGYSNQEVISMVRGGELLACPADCPGPIYGLMRECWRHTPTRRPHFEDISNRLHAWVQSGGMLGDLASSDSSTTSGSHRAPMSSGDPRERIPLLGPHASSSNGFLTAPSARKLSFAGSSSPCPKVVDDNCSSCSELPTSVVKLKKGSCGSLIESDKISNKDTLGRISRSSFPQDI